MSKPNIFIIESLSYQDEKDNHFEGKILSDLLHLSGKKCIYYYIRTESELVDILEKFNESDYRYLHISCHGNDRAVSTTIDVIPFDKFAKIVTPYLDKKRLFLSSCSVASYSLGSQIYSQCKSKCLSVIGPKKDINFNDAAIAWASFYHLMFKYSQYTMTNENIFGLLGTLNGLYGTTLHFINKTSFEKQRNAVIKFLDQIKKVK